MDSGRGNRMKWVSVFPCWSPPLLPVSPWWGWSNYREFVTFWESWIVWSGNKKKKKKKKLKLISFLSESLRCLFPKEDFCSFLFFPDHTIVSGLSEKYKLSVIRHLLPRWTLGGDRGPTRTNKNPFLTIPPTYQGPSDVFPNEDFFFFFFFPDRTIVSRFSG